MLEVGFPDAEDARVFGVDERCSAALRSNNMGMLSMLVGVPRISAPAAPSKRAVGDLHRGAPLIEPEEAAERFRLALEAVHIGADVNGWFAEHLGDPQFAAKMLALGWSCNCSVKTDAEFRATLLELCMQSSKGARKRAERARAAFDKAGAEVAAASAAVEAAAAGEKRAALLVAAPAGKRARKQAVQQPAAAAKAAAAAAAAEADDGTLCCCGGQKVPEHAWCSMMCTGA